MAPNWSALLSGLVVILLNSKRTDNAPFMGFNIYGLWELNAIQSHFLHFSILWQQPSRLPAQIAVALTVSTSKGHLGGNLIPLPITFYVLDCDSALCFNVELLLLGLEILEI